MRQFYEAAFPQELTLVSLPRSPRPQGPGAQDEKSAHGGPRGVSRPAVRYTVDDFQQQDVQRAVVFLRWTFDEDERVGVPPTPAEHPARPPHSAPQGVVSLSSDTKRLRLRKPHQLALSDRRLPLRGLPRNRVS